MGAILGIDFGTTNTSACLVQPTGRELPLVLGPATKPDTMRSAVLFQPQGETLVGEAAVREYEERRSSRSLLVPSPAIPVLLESFKPALTERSRGRTLWARIDKPGRLVDSTIDEGTRVVGASTRYVLRTEALPSHILPDGVTVAQAEQAAQTILGEVKRKLDEQCGPVSIDRVVMGIPIGFSETGKERLVRAAVVAELAPQEKISLLHEPIAVALAYGAHARKSGRFLVFDNGGGTVDMTVLNIRTRRNGEPQYTILAQDGHPRAGRWYDRLLFEAILQDSGGEREAVLSHLGVANPLKLKDQSVLEALQRVKERLFAPARPPAGPYTRRRLADAPNAGRQDGSVRFLYPFGDCTVVREVSSELFVRAIHTELSDLEIKLRRVLAAAAERGGHPAGPHGPEGIDEVLMAGGSSQLPCMLELVSRVLPGVPVNTQFAGSRTSTIGFARAAEQRHLIDELTDTAYGVYDGRGSTCRIVSVGTSIADTLLAHTYGSPDGLYGRTKTEPEATVIVCASEDERWEPVLQVAVSGFQPGDPIQFAVEVDRHSRRPSVTAASCLSGRRLRVDPVLLSAVLEKGQVIRFSGNHLKKTYREAGCGCLHRIDSISTGDPVEWAVGNIRQYRLYVHDATGASLQVVADAGKLQVYAIDMPRPGTEIDLRHLSNELFQNLPAGEVSLAVPCSRPSGMAQLAAADLAEGSEAIEGPLRAAAGEPAGR